MDQNNYTFDSWVRYDDGKLILAQMKGAEKGSKGDKALSRAPLTEQFIDKLPTVEEVAVKKGDAEFAEMVRQAKAAGKLYAELSVSRRLSADTRAALIKAAATHGYKLWIVAPGLEATPGADRMVRLSGEGDGNGKWFHSLLLAIFSGALLWPGLWLHGDALKRAASKEERYWRIDV